MINPKSPDYLAGLAAGRRSFRIIIMQAKANASLVLVNSELPLLCGFGGLGVTAFGPFTLLIKDSLPGTETYPDADL